MASAPAISAAAMIRGIFRYESRAGAGPMQTSSSAKRTWSDSRSASEYTATVWIPSSRHARITRRAISPRFAIRTFLNISVRPSAGHVLADVVPPGIARTGNSLNAKREFARVRCVVKCVLVRDDSLLVPVHQRLIEALHSVLHSSFGDQLRDVERLGHVADVLANCRGVHEDLRGRNAARFVGARNEAQGDNRFERAGKQETNFRLLVRRIKRQDSVDCLRCVGGVKRGEHEVSRVCRFHRRVERIEISNFADEQNVGVLTQNSPEGLREARGVSYDFALIDVRLVVAMQELDRVFNSYDVCSLVLIDILDHRSKRGGFARSSDSRNQNESARLERDLLEDCREIQLGDRVSLERHDTERVSDRSTLLICVNTKAANSGNTERKVGFLDFGELLLALRRHYLVGQCFHVVRAHRRHRQITKLTVHPKRWGASDFQMKIRRV